MQTERNAYHEGGVKPALHDVRRPGLLRNRSVLQGLTWLIVLLGIALRLVVYIQNRDLIIDEANLARNLFEKDPADFFAQLQYEQYAPPLFLILSKAVSYLAGYGAYALRLIPLLSSIAALILLCQTLYRLGFRLGAWFPVWMMATGFYFVRYASEFKQYSTDILVTVVLIRMAAGIDMARTRKIWFVLAWAVAGSLSIWLSMPSVFVLAGVSGYYLYRSRQYRDLAGMWMTLLLTLVWAVQFFIYYTLLLKTDITSDYLQNYHAHFFLHILPSGREEWLHNINLIMEFTGAVAGHWTLSMILTLLLLTAGILHLLRYRKALLLLILLPVLAMFAAAALRQYSLIPRLTLFAIPPALLLTGIGMDRLLRIRNRILYVPLAGIVLIAAYNFSARTAGQLPVELEEITRTMQYAVDRGIEGGNIHVQHPSVPAFIYYTQIHPQKNRWASVRNAHLLSWNASYDSLADNNRNTCFAFISAWETDPGIKEQVIKLETQLHFTDSLSRPGYHIRISGACVR